MQAVIDLVDNQANAAALAQCREASQVRRTRERTGGIARRAHQHRGRALVTGRRCQPRRQLIIGAGIHAHCSGDGVHRFDKVAIARIARIRQQHIAARIGQHRQGHQQCAARPRRDEYAARVDADFVGTLIVPGDGLAQGWQPSRRLIPRQSIGQRLPTRLANRRCGGKVGLADLHVDDVRTARLKLARPGQQGHDMKGLNAVTARGKIRAWHGDLGE